MLSEPHIFFRIKFMELHLFSWKERFEISGTETISIRNLDVWMHGNFSVRAVHIRPRSDTYVRKLMKIVFGVVRHAWRVLSWSNRTSSLSSLCIVRVEALIKPEPYIRQEKFVPVGSQNLNFDILSQKVFVTCTSSFLRDERTISGIQ